MELTIEQPEEETTAQTKKLEFYVVSPKKFLLLFIGTFSLYSFYWFYKNWDLYKKSTDEEMWPIMRAIFSIFFVHSLFELIANKYREQTKEKFISVSYLATIYVILTILSRISDKLSDNEILIPFTYYISFLSLPVIGAIFYKVQLLINTACDIPNGNSNNKLTPLNYMWLILGGVIWLLVLLSIYAT